MAQKENMNSFSDLECMKSSDLIAQFKSQYLIYHITVRKNDEFCQDCSSPFLRERTEENIPDAPVRE